MSIPDWNPDFSVGHPLLDEQHKALLVLCKRAADCVEDDSLEGTEYFHVLLNDLAIYAKTHFRTEEEILSQCNYPLLSEQKKEHEQYETRLGIFIFTTMFGDADKVGVRKFLSEWWLHHILESDMGYSDFVQGTGQEQ